MDSSVNSSDWSFSDEWAEFNGRKVEKTWAWTLPVRTAMFFREVDLPPDELATMDVLDAGCGNGQLTNAIGDHAKSVTGVDRSSSIEHAERVRTQPNVRYVPGDLNDPPFPPASFDLVYSSGVLHHNPDTEAAFKAVAKLVRPGGRFYCWLYRADLTLPSRMNLWLNEVIRWPVCRLPAPARTVAARLHAAFYHAVLSVLRPGKYTYNEHVIAAYDAICCRHAHRHTFAEMARWFHEAGFDSPKLTHWDNRSGIGMVAVKAGRGAPAGPRFSL